MAPVAFQDRLVPELAVRLWEECRDRMQSGRLSKSNWLGVLAIKLLGMEAFFEELSRTRNCGFRDDEDAILLDFLVVSGVELSARGLHLSLNANTPGASDDVNNPSAVLAELERLPLHLRPHASIDLAIPRRGLLSAAWDLASSLSVLSGNSSRGNTGGKVDWFMLIKLIVSPVRNNVALRAFMEERLDRIHKHQQRRVQWRDNFLHSSKNARQGPLTLTEMLQNIVQALHEAIIAGLEDIVYEKISLETHSPRSAFETHSSRSAFFDPNRNEFDVPMDTRSRSGDLNPAAPLFYGRNHAYRKIGSQLKIGDSSAKGFCPSAYRLEDPGLSQIPESQSASKSLNINYKVGLRF